MGKLFSICPSWWVRNSKLKKLKGGESTGVSIAAIKCILGISVMVNFNTRSAKVSFSDLEKLTGLSRPMVSKGIARLEKLKIIKVSRNYHTNEYKLNFSDDDEGWAKVPVDRIKLNLPSISNRGQASLVALKIYMVVISVRNNKTIRVPIAYKTLTAYTGVQKAKVRAGLDILYSHSLLHVTPPDDNNSSNIYTILGLDSN
jgi:hypothetical protein